MNIVKKLSIVFIIVMLIICVFTNKTYATLNCNVNLSTTKNKVTYEEKFSVNVAISNLQTTNGIIAIGAIISYDTESLTLVSIEGQNNWSNPFHNASNGKLTSFKNELSTKNENVFKITFKANEKGKAKNSAWIKISDFEISDGEGEKNCGGSSINIAIKDKENTNTGNNNQGSNNQGSNNQGSNNQGSNNQGSNNQGSNNQGSNNQGSNNQGSNNQGNNNQGNNNQGNNNQGSNNQGSSNQGGNNQTSNTTKKPGNNQITEPSTGTTNPVENSSTNEITGENINTNNVDTNSIGNVEGEENTNNESETNNVQNVFENNVEESRKSKTMNKGLFYTISVIGIVVIIAILFVIVKYWKIK